MAAPAGVSPSHRAAFEGPGVWPNCLAPASLFWATANPPEIPGIERPESTRRSFAGLRTTTETRVAP